MASDTSQGDSQEWRLQKVKRASIRNVAVGAICGAFIGAGLGTETLPGVGTVIGGFVGAMIGANLPVESDDTPYEGYLNKQGWMPYGIQKVAVGPEGGIIALQPKADSRINFKEEDVIQLVVPKYAVGKQGGGKMPIRHGILLNGKFKLKAGYKLVSPVVYVNYDEKDTSKPFELQLPHWSGDEDVIIATAAQDDKEGGDITFKLKEETVSSSSRNAAISSVSGSELYAVAVKEESKSNFYAIPHKIPIKNGRGVELSVIISYASSVWCKILCELYFPDGNFPYPCPVFQILDSSIRPILAKDNGPGWEATLCGYREIGLKQIDKDSHDIKDGDQLKEAVTSKRYPPRFVCEVNWSAEAKAHGQQRQVEVFIEGINPELAFSCITFEGPGKCKDERAAQEDSLHTEVKRPGKGREERATPKEGLHTEVKTPVPGPSKVHVSSNPEERFYSHVGARDAQVSDLSPSESELLRVLDIVPEWYDLSVALGVPVERVKQFQRIKTGGIEALCYWRCGESGQNYPTSWRFLLNKIEECHGHNVVQDIKKVFFSDSLMTEPKKTFSSSDPVTSTPQAYPFGVSDQLLESSPDPQCVAIIEKYKDRFLLYIDACAIARKLEIEGVIPDTVSHKIQQSAPSVANEVLFLHLQSHSSLETLHKLCDVMISMSGYPNMNELGRSMKDALTTV